MNLSSLIRAGGLAFALDPHLGCLWRPSSCRHLLHRNCHGAGPSAAPGLACGFDRARAWPRRGGDPLAAQTHGQQVPPIHDITTDTENPPEFVAVVPLRRNAPNPTDYGGAGLAAQQRAAYADLKPVFLKVSPEQAFVNALAVARDMGWEIVDAQASEGRIEATDTTFWFGFKDDVVVRIKAADQGSRIDVRSVSRVGKSDVGTNAKRIRAYLERLTR